MADESDTRSPSPPSLPAASTASQRVVAVAVEDATIAGLLADALQDEGYDVRPLALSQDITRLVAEMQPHSLVLECGATETHLALLDALRAVPATSRTALITFGPTDRLQELSQASGNVHTALGMPFDLGDFLDAVSRAASARPAEARLLAQPLEEDYGYRRAADALSSAERQLMLEWAQRIRVAPDLANRNDLDLRDFLDNLPRILNLVVLALRHQGTTHLLGEVAETRARILAHVATRVRQHISAETLVLEYQVLRHAIRHRLARDIGIDDTWHVLDKLEHLLDDVVRLTVAEYVRLQSDPPDAATHGDAPV